jgi:hypothetical protein
VTLEHVDDMMQLVYVKKIAAWHDQAMKGNSYLPWLRWPLPPMIQLIYAVLDLPVV